MILLFTTTKRPLYKRDVLNVCCFPDDAYLRFGYQRKLIQENLQPEGGKAMKGKEALIVFCEFCPGSTFSEQSKHDFSIRYHPIRFVKINEANEDALGSFVLTLQLKDFFDYASQADLRIDAFAKCISNSNERPYTTGKEETDAKRPAHHVVEAPADCQYHRNGNWGNLIAHTGGLRELDDCVFFCYKPANNRSALKGPFWKSDTCRPDYEIAGGMTSLVTLQLLFGKKAAHRAPDLVVRADVATVCGPFSRQSSNGWETEFLVAFRRSFQKELSTLVFRVPPPSPESKPLSPEWNGLICIRASWGLLTAAIVLLMLGTALQAFSPEFSTSLSPKMKMDKESITTIVKLIGTSILGIGAFIGLKKLPVKGGGD
jgi:hypothetical protein